MSVVRCSSWLPGCAGRRHVRRRSAVPLQRGGGWAALAVGGVLRGGAAGLACAPGLLCTHQDPLALARLAAAWCTHTKRAWCAWVFETLVALHVLGLVKSPAAFRAAPWFQTSSVHEQRSLLGTWPRDRVLQAAEQGYGGQVCAWAAQGQAPPLRSTRRAMPRWRCAPWAGSCAPCQAWLPPVVTSCATVWLHRCASLCGYALSGVSPAVPCRACLLSRLSIDAHAAGCDRSARRHPAKWGQGGQG